MLTWAIQLHILNNVVTGYRFLDHSASTVGGGSLIHAANIPHVQHKWIWVCNFSSGFDTMINTQVSTFCVIWETIHFVQIKLVFVFLSRSPLNFEHRLILVCPGQHVSFRRILLQGLMKVHLGEGIMKSVERYFKMVNL
jgi:hypothetical protein